MHNGTWILLVLVLFSQKDYSRWTFSYGWTMLISKLTTCKGRPSMDHHFLYFVTFNWHLISLESVPVECHPHVLLWPPLRKSWIRYWILLVRHTVELRRNDSPMALLILGCILLGLMNSYVCQLLHQKYIKFQPILNWHENLHLFKKIEQYTRQFMTMDYF